MVTLNLCSDCNTPLTDENWYPSRKKLNQRYCSSCCKLRRNDWNKRNPERHREGNRQFSLKAKIEAIQHYSNGTGACANPYGQHDKPYTDIRALTLDLIENGHRKSGLPYGMQLCAQLRKEGYPEGWQVFCGSCQMIKETERRFSERVT